jgi:hypothetical protein
MYLLRYGPLAGLHIHILALHFCTGSTYAAKHKEVRERSNRSYGYAFRSRAAPTDMNNPARRTGRTNAAKPMDGRERPTPAILVRNTG